ncbi:YibE/F family protein [Propionibacteriaceae bacterium Y2011]
MSHTHTHTHAETTPEAEAHQRRAFKTMILIVIPIAVWTVVAMIVMWPHDVADHIRSDTSSYSVEGLTIPTGRVVSVTEHSCDGEVGSVPGVESTCASGEVQVTEGPEKDSIVQVEFTAAHYASGVKEGTKVKLFRIPLPDGGAAYQFADFERSTPLIVFILGFCVAVVVVARFRGFMGLVGLGFAAVVITQFMFPALVSGDDPVLVGLVGSSAIMFVVLYTAHGFSARTTTALLGTLFGLAVAAGLGVVATRWAHLTGVASEEDYLLAASAPDMQLTSVVICGIIVAGLGVMNDVTITQASAVWELSNSGQRSAAQLFTSAMRIGRDHIASTVYTIAFATAGASLSTLLLISVYQRGMWEVIQTEVFSAEILRTVVGSIGLVLAMPLTTAIGVAAVRLGSRPPAEVDDEDLDDELDEDLDGDLDEVEVVEDENFGEDPDAPYRPTSRR